MKTKINLEAFNARLELEYTELFQTPDFSYAASRTTPSALARKMTLGLDNGTANKCFRYSLRATDAGWMSADGVTANYSGCAPGTNLPYPDALATGYAIYAFNGSWIAARDAVATNAKHSGVLASNGCTIHVRGATLTDCGENGVYASPCSTVDATTTDVSGAGNFGYFASGGSTISAASSTANNCGTGVNDAAAYADAASRINVENLTATGCSGIVIRCSGYN